MPTSLVRISLPSATFGVVVAGGVVAQAAPIAKWAIGKRGRGVVSCCRARGATVEVWAD